MIIRRGFTFIELLVVFAIIAILAIILFPVFASVTHPGQFTERRIAASLNNAKQIGTAALLYAVDYDDRSPMHQSWQANAPIFIGGCGMVTWGQACLPYITNSQILNDPLAQRESPANGFPPETWLAIFPQYGMNHTVWSGMIIGGGGGTCSNPWRPRPIIMTAVARPAEVPLFVSKSTSLEQGSNGALWWFGAGTLISTNIVDPPTCADGPAPCFGNWGNGSTWDTILQSGGLVAGRYTGGNSRRRANSHVVLLGDGHAELLPAEKLAAGSSWQDNTSWPAGSTVVTDPSIYRWTSQ
jgi:prepilin-type N-terminal cleavage/methylation domain-containing protein